MPLSPDQVAALLDHAILHPTVTDAALRQEIEKLRVYPLASFCVKPSHVRAAVDLVAGTAIKIGTVIGFPHGTTTTATKVAETEEAIAHGAAEVDMVVNVGKVLSDAWDAVQDDIRAVCEAAHARGAVVKVIFETDFVTDDARKIRLCEICTAVNADFVKTSTGFGYVKQADGGMGYRGATEHDIALMKRHSGAGMGIKPSGGIKSLQQVLRFVELGATRIGTGSGEAIMLAAHAHAGAAGTAVGAGKFEY